MDSPVFYTKGTEKGFGTCPAMYMKAGISWLKYWRCQSWPGVQQAAVNLAEVEFHSWILLPPLTANGEFSQCEAQHLSSAQSPGFSGRSVWTARECRGPGEGGSNVKCDRGVMSTCGGEYHHGAAFLLWSAGLIRAALTGQDSHPGRGQNEGYVTLDLTSLNRTSMLLRILLPYCGTCKYYRSKLKWSSNLFIYFPLIHSFYHPPQKKNPAGTSCLDRSFKTAFVKIDLYFIA